MFRHSKICSWAKRNGHKYWLHNAQNIMMIGHIWPATPQSLSTRNYTDIKMCNCCTNENPQTNVWIRLKADISRCLLANRFSAFKEIALHKRNMPRLLLVVWLLRLINFGGILAVPASSLWFGFYSSLVLFVVCVLFQRIQIIKVLANGLRFAVCCLRFYFSFGAPFAFVFLCSWMLISALALFVLQSWCQTHTQHPPCAQLLVLDTMEYACFNYGAQKPKHRPRWTIVLRRGAFYICSANGSLYTSKWEAQKALEKRIPLMHFSTFPFSLATFIFSNSYIQRQLKY